MVAFVFLFLFASSLGLLICDSERLLQVPPQWFLASPSYLIFGTEDPLWHPQKWTPSQEWPYTDLWSSMMKIVVEASWSRTLCWYGPHYFPCHQCSTMPQIADATPFSPTYYCHARNHHRVSEWPSFSMPLHHRWEEETLAEQCSYWRERIWK